MVLKPEEYYLTLKKLAPYNDEILKLLKPVNPYKNQILTYQQAVNLVKREDILCGDNPLLPEIEVSWEVAKKWYEKFPNNVKTKIRKSGQQTIQGWYDPSTNKLSPPGSPPSRERGIWIVQMWLQQNATCAYTGMGPFHILDFQVEHRDPNGGDWPKNVVLVLANVNENRKQSSMTDFINRHKERLDEMNEEEYQNWYHGQMTKKEKNKEWKATILGMTAEEVRAEWTDDPSVRPSKIPKDFEKYIWRISGMSSLGNRRLRRDGEERSGGSQGNYKDVLNVINREHFYGDKKLAKQIFDSCHEWRNRFLDGECTCEEYAKETVKQVKKSKYSKFASKNLERTIIRNNYDSNKDSDLWGRS